MERRQEVFQEEAVNGWAGCFVVMTDPRIRLRRPPVNIPEITILR
jgi:hypothetical protein